MHEGPTHVLDSIRADQQTASDPNTSTPLCGPSSLTSAPGRDRFGERSPVVPRSISSPSKDEATPAHDIKRTHAASAVKHVSEAVAPAAVPAEDAGDLPAAKAAAAAPPAAKASPAKASAAKAPAARAAAAKAPAKAPAAKAAGRPTCRRGATSLRIAAGLAPLA